MAGHYIRSAILSGSVELIAEHGVDAEPLARAAGLDPAALRDPELPVPGWQVIDYFERAAQACDCRSFGLRMASRANLAVVGPLWLLLRQADSIGQMLQDLVSHFDLYTRAARAGLVRQPDGMLLTWSTATGQIERETQTAEYSVALLCNELRRHLPSGWEPRRVTFRHAPPRDLGAHRKVLGPHLEFECPQHGILVERAVLDLPLRHTGSRTRTLLSHMLRREDGPADPGVVERVDAVVRAMLPYARCTLLDVSRAMGLAPRTLQEHLQAQQRSFKDVKDAVRADLALKYLRHSRLSLTQIAEILGYAEPSALSRAFRRWHGVSARSLRARSRRERDTPHPLTPPRAADREPSR